MPAAIQAKSLRPKTQKKTTKVCSRCGKIKMLTDYYSNRDWVEQAGRDAWCKDCVAECTSKAAIRRYFWENHRNFTEELWLTAANRAETQANATTAFKKMPDERKEKIIEKITCSIVPKIMNSNYKFIENAEGQSFEEAMQDGKIIETLDEHEKKWSPKFNGYFKRSELEYLENYYENMEQDFDLNDINLQDMAKKVAKASLLADKAQNDFMAGNCDFDTVRNAMAQYDMLSKSGNFAACKRKPGENTGLSSWSEISLKCEQTGHPCTRKIEWEQDDIDKTINEYRYIVEALELDTI